jgi:hypothetical protein
LIHADLGGHDLAKNGVFANALSPYIEPILDHGGIMVSSDRMYFHHLKEIPLPQDAVPGRCHIYQRG